MCTVSYIPVENGFILTSSRDEQLTRPRAKLYFPNMIHRQEVSFPEDPQGLGTWIASSSTRTVCLLNGAFTAHQPNPPYRHSRGLVVLDVFKYISIQSFGANYYFVGLEPFTLLLVEEGVLIVLSWDGNSLTKSEKEPQKPHIWSSSTLYSPEIVQERERWFYNWLMASTNKNLEGIRDFHKTAGDNDPQNSILMRRGNKYATVSLTSVVQTASQMEMVYEDLIVSEITTNILSGSYARI